MAGARTSKLLVLVVVMALLGLAAGTSGLLGSAQAGKTITVGPSGCDFTTIQAAIDAAPNGSIIQVQTGSYKENLTIRNRDGLTLQGAGADKVTLDGNGSQQKDAPPGILILSSRNITVTGFRITNSRRGLEADDSTLLFIEANVFERNLRTGIYLLRSQAEIRDNVVRSNEAQPDRPSGGNGISINASQGILTGNSITDNAGAGLDSWTTEGSLSHVSGGNNTVKGNRGGDLSGNVPTTLLAEPPAEGTLDQVAVPSEAATIQEAVNRVKAGGTITVSAGTYREQVQIYKSATIRGAGVGRTILQAPGPDWLALNVATDGLAVTLEGLTVTGGYGGILIATGPAGTIALRDVKVEGDPGGKYTLLCIWEQPTVTLDRVSVSGSRYYGLDVSGQVKLTVENSTITNSSVGGVAIGRSAVVTMRGTTIANSGSAGVYMVDSASANIQKCTISDNVIAGIQLTDSSQVTVADTRVTGTRVDSNGKYGNGISASKESRTALQNSTISSNALWGVRFYESATGTVEKSVISDNGNAGIVVRGSANVTVDGSTIARNAEEGIFAGDSAQVEITNNQITASRTAPAPPTCCGFGINVIQNAQATIRGNTIAQNANAGIILQETAQATIQQNTISDNTAWGIYVIGSSHAAIEDNTITKTKPAEGKTTARGIQLSGDGRTTILRNQITQNKEYGMAVGFAVQVMIQDNTITGNAGSGVKVGFSDVANETVQAEISRNTIQKNGSCGITVAEDEPALKITGQANTISGNTKGQLCGAMSKFPKGFGGGK